MMTKELHVVLNQQVANFAVLTEKIHHYHYYVSGPSFFTLHNGLRKPKSQKESKIHKV